MCGAAVLAAIALSTAVAPAAGQGVRLELVASGLSAPVFVTGAGDGSGRLFVVEQGGVIKVMSPGGTPSVFLDIRARVSSGGERGLLGLAFHPGYAGNGRFFVDYTRAGDGATVIAEYRVSPTDPGVAEAARRRCW